MRPACTPVASWRSVVAVAVSTSERPHGIMEPLKPPGYKLHQLQEEQVVVFIIWVPFHKPVHQFAEQFELVAKSMVMDRLHCPHS